MVLVKTKVGAVWWATLSPTNEVQLDSRQCMGLYLVPKLRFGLVLWKHGKNSKFPVLQSQPRNQVPKRHYALRFMVKYHQTVDSSTNPRPRLSRTTGQRTWPSLGAAESMGWGIDCNGFDKSRAALRFAFSSLSRLRDPSRSEKKSLSCVFPAAVSVLNTRHSDGTNCKRVMRSVPLRCNWGRIWQPRWRS